MGAPRIFPLWRDLWAQTDGLTALLNAADAALRTRSTRNQRMPRWPEVPDKKALSTAIRAAEFWASGSPPQDECRRYAIACNIFSVLKQPLEAAAWPRWLLLEQAFLDASSTGDLLFSALCLRTMCEEVQRLHVIALDERQIAELAGSQELAQKERLEIFMAVSWTMLGSFLPERTLDRKEWPLTGNKRERALLSASPPRLETIRAALNAFVHPNYGSHIAALFPEDPSTGRLLLEAVLAVHDAFSALPWVSAQAHGPAPLRGATDSWSRTVRRFTSRIIPEARRSATDPALLQILELPSVIAWLDRAQDQAADLLDVPDMHTLVRDLPHRLEGKPTQSRHTAVRLWEGARAEDVVTFVAARQAERLLAAEFPQGAPAVEDQLRWLRFNSLSLQLAMLLDQTKAAAFKVQLVRQLVRGNPLGTSLCMRSLIEHRALVVALPVQVTEAIDAVAKEVRATEPLPEVARQVSKPIIDFLATNVTLTRDEQRAWVVEEDGGVRKGWLNLNAMMNRAFDKDDRFHRIYQIASAEMHGRRMRGVDLMTRRDAADDWSRSIAMLVLERVCNRQQERDHLFSAAIQIQRLDHAAKAGGTTIAETDSAARSAFGLILDRLVQGIDFDGDGTADRPIRFRQHLEMQTASYAFLRQKEIDPLVCRRTLLRANSGRLCDRWQTPIGDFWFDINAPE